MSDQHKPLTAGEIEEWRNILDANKSLDSRQWPEANDIGEKMFRDFPRLLSMLTPPTDAVKCEVCDGSGELQDAQAWDCGQDNSPCPYCRPTDAALREAVDRLDNSEYTISLDGSRDDTAQMWEDIDTLIAHARAVQAPRLTGEEVEVLVGLDMLLRKEGWLAVASTLRATFPAAFPGVGE